MKPAGKGILRLHLKELLKTDTSKLDQVTVIRSLPLVRNGNFEKLANYYWNIDHLLKQFKCKTEVIDVPDKCFSYSSWVQAAMKYRNQFDYYILIEDDYYPSHQNFVNILLQEHKRRLPNGGYLNGFMAYGHAAVSNGIADSKSFLEGIDKYEDPVMESTQGQSMFGTSFFGTKMADYVDKYRCLFKSDRIVNEVHDEFSTITEDIFRPIQYLVTGEQEFQKVSYDIKC